MENGRKVLTNIVSSQIEIHKLFGGVVPEVASRNHIKNIVDVLQEAISTSGKTLEDVDAIAVTYGAGLVGALLVGVNFAKTLAYALKKPLIAVSHRCLVHQGKKDQALLPLCQSIPQLNRQLLFQSY